MRHRNVLAIAAHPSDLEYHAGATLAGLVADGATVVMALCSDAACGPGGGPELAATRRAEAERSARVLGAAALLWCEPQAGEERHAGLVARLVREIRRRRADLVLVHDPTTWWKRGAAVARLGHAEHRAAGRAALEAIHPRAEQAHFLPELADEELPPWLVRELWLFDTEAPNHVVDATRAWELKEAMLACHASQLPLLRTEEAAAEAEALRGPGGTRAEAFRRLVLL